MIRSLEKRFEVDDFKLKPPDATRETNMRRSYSQRALKTIALEQEATPHEKLLNQIRNFKFNVNENKPSMQSMSGGLKKSQSMLNRKISEEAINEDEKSLKENKNSIDSNSSRKNSRSLVALPALSLHDQSGSDIHYKISRVSSTASIYPVTSYEVRRVHSQTYLAQPMQMFKVESNEKIRKQSNLNDASASNEKPSITTMVFDVTEINAKSDIKSK